MTQVAAALLFKQNAKHISRTMKLTEVFKTQGKPSVTYVSPTDGRYEASLKVAIENKGTLCLVTGPSKTGKTTLVAKVAEQCGLELIQIRCDDELTAEEFWRRALEHVNFERLEQRTNGAKNGQSWTGKLSGSIGWKWLAGLTGEFSTTAARELTDSEVREKILAKPSPQHLIPILKKLAALLVIEDFHYLKDSVKVTIFQQWKAFTDEEVSVVLLSTTHHACDLAYSNKDLIGRISKIELTTWLHRDLVDILRRGARALNITFPETILQKIAEESVGLPIITQSVALELLLRKNVLETQVTPVDVAVTRSDLQEIFHEVATGKYGQFEVAYDRMVGGLRKRRRYKTYECMLGAFSLDPVVYRLPRHELCERVSRLPIPNSELPPEGSIRKSLGLVNQLQEKVGIQLLEWVERDDTLYVVDPTFLYYLRWRRTRGNSIRPDPFDVIRDLLRHLEVTESARSAVRTIRIRKPLPPSDGLGPKEPAS